MVPSTIIKATYRKREHRAKCGRSGIAYVDVLLAKFTCQALSWRLLFSDKIQGKKHVRTDLAHRSQAMLSSGKGSKMLRPAGGGGGTRQKQSASGLLERIIARDTQSAQIVHTIDISRIRFGWSEKACQRLLSESKGRHAGTLASDPVDNSERAEIHRHVYIDTTFYILQKGDQLESQAYVSCLHTSSFISRNGMRLHADAFQTAERTRPSGQ
jgi:hypothetical protein